MADRITKHVELVEASRLDCSVDHRSPRPHYVSTKGLRQFIQDNKAFGNMAVSVDALHRAAARGLILEHEEKRTRWDGAPRRSHFYYTSHEAQERYEAELLLSDAERGQRYVDRVREQVIASMAEHPDRHYRWALHAEHTADFVSARDAGLVVSLGNGKCLLAEFWDEYLAVEQRLANEQKAAEERLKRAVSRLAEVAGPDGEGRTAYYSTEQLERIADALGL